jgi:cobalt/nickel transport system permease protein
MHIPDGFIALPIHAAGFAVAGAACLLAAQIGKRRLDDQQVPLLGMTSAFVFAAQMLNFPIAGGTSGHFLGAVFCAALLGPWMACLSLALVLIVQCLLFADGGITALGTNITNMAVIGVGVGFGAMRLVQAVLPASRRTGLAAVAIGAWSSVMAASVACAIELAWSGKPLAVVLPAMLGVHAAIGVGEAIITVSALSLVLTARPDLVPGLARRELEAAS